MFKTFPIKQNSYVKYHDKAYDTVVTDKSLINRYQMYVKM